MEKSFKGSIAADWQVEIIAESNTVAVNVGELATVALVYGYNKEAQVANAHLIAASKDLLEACIADVRNMYDGEEHVGYEVVGIGGKVLCDFELQDFDHACQYVESLRKAAISKALNTTSIKYH